MDAQRRQTGKIFVDNAQFIAPTGAFGAGDTGGRQLATAGYNPSVMISVQFDTARVTLTGNANKPRAWVLWLALTLALRLYNAG